MRYIFLFLWAALAPCSAAGQSDAQATADSLAQVLATAKADTTKARTLCRLCEALTSQGDFSGALEKGAAGLEYARQADDAESVYQCQMNIGSASRYAGMFDGAISAFSEGLAIARTLNDQIKTARAYTGLGLASIDFGDNRRAYQYLLKARDIYHEIGDKKMKAATQVNLAILLAQKGDYARALKFYLGALPFYESTGNKRSHASLLKNIGIIYSHKKEYDEALTYFRKSLALRHEIGDSARIARGLNAVGSTYLSIGAPDSALVYFQQALALQEKAGSVLGKSIALSSIGKSLKMKGEFERALFFFNESLNIARQIGDAQGIITVLVERAYAYAALNRPEEGRTDAQEALALAVKSDALLLKLDAAEVLAKLDAALGDYKSAYEHYKLFKQYSDSLNNQAQSKEIGRLEAQYDFDKEIEERERLEAEAAERRQMFYWIAAGVFAALLLVAGLLTWGFQTKKKANQQLSAQNAEIIQQSEEISQQRDELQAMNDQITEQRDVLEKAHEEITDSIDYASRIQLALLPGPEAMKRGGEVFVYYKARDVVSGDFYWTHQIDEDTFLYAAVDCTGHGVPGAFMSVLGSTTLDTIVREFGETRPDLLLSLLDKNVRASLKQDQNEAAHKDGSLDGMDLALVKLDRKRRVLEFSSAGRPLYLLRNGEVLEFRGAKFPAGGAQHGEKTFPLETIPLQSGDRFFLFSDGITDQFGGPRGRKFSPRRLKETLLAHADKDLQAQGAAFAEAFDDWQKNAKQLDDQLLVGLEV